MAALAVSLAAGEGRALDAPPEPSGYRLSDYRAPTPAGLTGAATVSDDEAMALWKSGNVQFIDVLPRPVRPANLAEGTLWRQPERRNIPGSAWLPNTGYGVLSAPVADYFTDNLVRLTGGDRDKPLLIYCLENCWMSWNAAKRALQLGYRKVYWYPAGTDGWARIGGALELAEPASVGN
jgi:PQQ-dependent catabolism-associated CXXCW motif protein